MFESVTESSFITADCNLASLAVVAKPLLLCSKELIIIDLRMFQAVKI